MKMTAEDRIEDLEEALRRIVTIVMHDHCHEVTEREHAVLTIALDQLGLDEPPELHLCIGSIRT